LFKFTTHTHTTILSVKLLFRNDIEQRVRLLMLICDQVARGFNGLL